jgi:hypothetical protein
MATLGRPVGVSGIAGEGRTVSAGGAVLVSRVLVRVAAIGVAAVLLVACGSEAPDVDDSGAIGPDAAVSQDVKVLQVPRS